jgi:hypothetical protein
MRATLAVLVTCREVKVIRVGLTTMGLMNFDLQTAIDLEFHRFRIVFSKLGSASKPTIP